MIHFQLSPSQRESTQGTRLQFGLPFITYGWTTFAAGTRNSENCLRRRKDLAAEKEEEEKPLHISSQYPSSSTDAHAYLKAYVSAQKVLSAHCDVHWKATVRWKITARAVPISGQTVPLSCPMWAHTIKR